MKKVLLSDSGPETSEAIYSFWRWNNNEDLNLAKIQDVLEYVISLGINALDVSSIYGNGKIQELLGDNKHPQLDGNYQYEPLTEKSILKQVDTLLSSLKTDYIDVLLIEDFDPLMNVDVVASVLTSLQLRGKIKHVGVSNFNVQQHKLFASRLSEEVVTNHFELNLLQTKALEDGRLDFIKEQYSKPMAFGPLADGRILQGQDAKAIAIRKVLSSLTEKYQSNIEQIAVAWIHKLGALPIIGSLSKERIHNAATAGDIQLSYQDWHQVYETIKSINS